MEPAKLISDCGGASKLARAIGTVPVSTVAYWQRRNSIPVRYWPAVIVAAKAAGVVIGEADMVAIHVGHTAIDAVKVPLHESGITHAACATAQTLPEAREA